MLKDIADLLKAALDFIRNIKAVCTVLISSALWVILSARTLLPVPKTFADSSTPIAWVLLVLSGVYLVVHLLESLYKTFQLWRQSDERKFRTALAKASPLEKTVLEAIVSLGGWLIELDVGSPIALHLQELGLIRKSHGRGYMTYELTPGLDVLCLKTPSLLRVSEAEQTTAMAEMEKWGKNGQHRRFFKQLGELTNGGRGNPNSWMG